ncbi:hypothetical protein [Streptomyces sp. NPDC056304]|uniref:hypothetical protein n=1 Tax=Streptomyces sp. NPDC056304 TaxID=3345778 RepID=UPI0035DDF4BF
MAKYWVTRACGHDERVDLTGPHKRREQVIERMEESDCGNCVETQRQKENAANAAAAQAVGWPRLAGTERQVAWAETLRAGAVAELRRDAGWWPEHYSEATGDPLPFIETAMLAVTDASWWIDNRYELVGAAVGLTAVDVAHAVGLLAPLDRNDLGPHVLVRPSIDLPRPDPHAPCRKVQAAVCSCGWQPSSLLRALNGAFEHIKALGDDEREAIRKAHPQDQPHACTEAPGLRRCVMRPFLRQ